MLQFSSAASGGPSPAARPPLAPPTDRRAAASVEDLVKVYGAGANVVVALDHVSARFAEAELTAIMGPSGSGKSTLLHTLAGLDRPTSGLVTIGDEQISSLPERRLTQVRRDRIGFVFQSFNLLPMLTALENITLPLDLAGRRPDEDWLDRIVTTIGLRDRLDHLPAELSGGQQQRVAVGRALVTRPSIVLADEPTGNLDSRAGAEILGFLRTSVREFGQSVVMVTHDAVAASYADRILFLADGAIVDELRDPDPAKVLDRMKRLERRPS